MAAKVKICGLTNLDDARRAADLGAWALGLIFHEPSPRACAESDALEIAAALHRRAQVCGVFVNRPLDPVRLADGTTTHGCTEFVFALDPGTDPGNVQAVSARIDQWLAIAPAS